MPGSSELTTSMDQSSWTKVKAEGQTEKVLEGRQPPLHTIVVRIEVSDTGLGIAPEDLDDYRLFSPYVQTELGRLQGGKGTGLGLAIVRSIVSLSGGRLGVITRKGHGSTFWMEMPLGTGLVSDKLPFSNTCNLDTEAQLLMQMKMLSSPLDPKFSKDQHKGSGPTAPVAVEGTVQVCETMNQVSGQRIHKARIMLLMINLDWSFLG